MGSSDSSMPEDIFFAIEELVQEPGQEAEPDLKRPAKEFDRQAFVAKMFGDIDLAREVAALFLSHTPQLMSTIRDALASKNAKTLADAAQSLKGSIANIGAKVALGTVTELEQLGHLTDLAEAAKTFQRLEAQIGSLRDALESVSAEPQPWKILIADDDPVSRRMLQATLMKWGHDPIVTADGASALKLLLGDDAPSMAILDWMMPGLQGIEVCRELRKRVKAGHVYLILLTGKDKTDDIIEGLDAGADDYLVKPFNPHELKARVREGFRALERFHGSVAEEPEPHGALIDVLGREAILVALKTEMTQPPVNPKAVGVIMVRLAAFQMIKNDFGSDAAGSAFGEVAGIAQTVVGQSDTVGRYGEDRLLLVLPGSDRKKVEELAETFRSRLESSSIQSDDVTLPVTACLGLTSIVPSGRVHVERVISAAESALKQAEMKGPNNHAFVAVESGEAKAVPSQQAPRKPISRLDLELVIASRAGDLKRVTQLVNSGADVNATDNKGNTPLMEATFLKYPEVVRFLLEKGAEVSIKNNGGDTALIEAIRAGHAEMVELLLPKFTAVDIKADVAPVYKALLEASAYRHTDVVKLVKDYLLARGYIRPRKKTTEQSA